MILGSTSPEAALHLEFAPNALDLQREKVMRCCSFTPHELGIEPGLSVRKSLATAIDQLLHDGAVKPAIQRGSIGAVTLILEFLRQPLQV